VETDAAVEAEFNDEEKVPQKKPRHGSKALVDLGEAYCKEVGQEIGMRRLGKEMQDVLVAVVECKVGIHSINGHEQEPESQKEAEPGIHLSPGIDNTASSDVNVAPAQDVHG
jgi:hypothetical protein